MTEQIMPFMGAFEEKSRELIKSGYSYMLVASPKGSSTCFVSAPSACKTDKLRVSYDTAIKECTYLLTGKRPLAPHFLELPKREQELSDLKEKLTANLAHLRHLEDEKAKRINAAADGKALVWERGRGGGQSERPGARAHVCDGRFLSLIASFACSLSPPPSAAAGCCGLLRAVQKKVLSAKGAMATRYNDSGVGKKFGLFVRDNVFFDDSKSGVLFFAEGKDRTEHASNAIPIASITAITVGIADSPALKKVADKAKPVRLCVSVRVCACGDADGSDGSDGGVQHHHPKWPHSTALLTTHTPLTRSLSSSRPLVLCCPCPFLIRLIRLTRRSAASVWWVRTTHSTSRPNSPKRATHSSEDSSHLRAGKGSSSNSKEISGAEHKGPARAQVLWRSAAGALPLALCRWRWRAGSSSADGSTATVR
jgi:hypothetical protein